MWLIRIKILRGFHINWQQYKLLGTSYKLIFQQRSLLLITDFLRQVKNNMCCVGTDCIPNEKKKCNRKVLWKSDPFNLRLLYYVLALQVNQLHSFKGLLQKFALRVLLYVAFHWQQLLRVSKILFYESNSFRISL